MPIRAIKMVLALGTAVFTDALDLRSPMWTKAGGNSGIGKVVMRTQCTAACGEAFRRGI